MIHITRAFLLAVLLLFATTVSATQGIDHSGHNMSQGKKAHSSMKHDSGAHSGHFKHSDMVDGIHANFQVMSLASMKIKDPDGKTHHIMVSFSQNKKSMKGVAGDIKVVSPSGKEQVGELQHFGGGMYAVNFTFDEAGDWQVTCNFKDGANGQKMKFNYPHKEM